MTKLATYLNETDFAEYDPEKDKYELFAINLNRFFIVSFAMKSLNESIKNNQSELTERHLQICGILGIAEGKNEIFDREHRHARQEIYMLLLNTSGEESYQSLTEKIVAKLKEARDKFKDCPDTKKQQGEIINGQAKEDQRNFLRAAMYR